MTIAVIGATGHIGREIVRGVLAARGEAVAALVRDRDEARRAFGEPDGLHIRPTRLDDPRVLAEPALWDKHHDLTGPVPMSWPVALEVLSAELGERVTFRVAAEPDFLQRLISAGVPAGEAELLITREWAIRAGENDYTSDTFQQITGRVPRPLADFLHEHRAEFV